MSRVRIHNFTISLDGFGTGEGHGEPIRRFTRGLENRYEIESVSLPSGVTHLTFTRADR